MSFESRSTWNYEAGMMSTSSLRTLKPLRNGAIWGGKADWGPGDKHIFKYREVNNT